MRKTNLFYTSGINSNFVTFSNYGEDLTKNFFSTLTKLIPSGFICLYIDLINQDFIGDVSPREAFIRYLISYYENKLAVLRDLLSHKATDNTSEYTKVFPMSYLIDAIMHVSFSNNNLTYSCTYNSSEICSSVLLQYIGSITDFDYNEGLFADFIMNIDDNDIYTFDLTPLTNTSIDDTFVTATFDNSADYLHGWENVSNNYTTETFVPFSLKPIYDESTDYSVSPKYSGIRYTKSSGQELNFNVIIPIYKKIVNGVTENVTIEDSKYTWLDGTTVNSYEETIAPYGIWIALQGQCINIPYDTINKIRPSWSLMLSSLFKPFPYSDYLNDSNKTTDNISAYTSFAEILKNYADVTKKLTKITLIVTNLSSSMQSVTLLLLNNLIITTDLIQSQELINSLLTKVNSLESKILELTDKLSLNTTWTYEDTKE